MAHVRTPRVVGVRVTVRTARAALFLALLLLCGRFALEVGSLPATATFGRTPTPAAVLLTTQATQSTVGVQPTPTPIRLLVDTSGMRSLPTRVAAPTPVLPPHDVEIIDDAFMPASITVKAGTTVTWLNTGGRVHDVFSGTSVWPAQPIEPEISWKLVFSNAGRYGYFCHYHPTMRGEVIVE